MRRLLPLALLLLLALPAAAQAADLPLRPKGDRSALGNERLSNERTVTRWAHTNLRGGIRSKPSWKSKAVGALRWNTEDGLPEVYLALASHVDHSGGQVWIKIRIPGRPNGRTGWIPAGSANLAPVYGPWAFGTAAYSKLSDWPGGGVVGIHGTNQPELIPGRPSHGCIRVPNPRIRKLARIMPVGTPVRIR